MITIIPMVCIGIILLIMCDDDGNVELLKAGFTLFMLIACIWVVFLWLRYKLFGIE